jgi:hypothetical protein
LLAVWKHCGGVLPVYMLARSHYISSIVNRRSTYLMGICHAARPAIVVIFAIAARGSVCQGVRGGFFCLHRFHH